jgi:histidinol-phosphatase
MATSKEMRTALTAARAAMAVLAAHAARRRRLRVTIKGDGSPVTAADLAAERAIRRVLGKAFPRDGVLGEEEGRRDGPSGRLWILDPLDSTRCFLRDLPFYSAQIALWEDGAARLGVSAAPAFAQIASAERGRGARIGREEGAVSAVARLADAHLSLGNLRELATGRLPQFGRLLCAAQRVRGYGDFFHYHALATGRLDAVVETNVVIYDVAALAVIVEESGGRVTDLEGAPLALDSTTIVATTGRGRLHDEILRTLRRPQVAGKPASARKRSSPSRSRRPSA